MTERKPTVLISSAAAKVLLVQSFQAAGARVVAMDSDPLSAALHRADAAYRAPHLDVPGALDALLCLCHRERVQLLVPTRDGELPFFSSNAAAFEAIGTRVLVSSPIAVDVCQDKRRFVDTCERLGIPVPRTLAPGHLPDTWPVFVRPIRGAGGVGAQRVDDQDSLMRLQRSPADELLIQEYVSVPEYSVDVLSDFDGQPLQAVVRRRTRVRAGEVVVSQVERRSALEDVALRFCGAMGIVGPCVVQAFDDDAVRPRLIEANPRFGGGSNLSIAAGLDSPARLLRLLVGDASARDPRPIREELVLLRYAQDVLVDASQLGLPTFLNV